MPSKDVDPTILTDPKLLKQIRTYAAYAVAAYVDYDDNKWYELPASQGFTSNTVLLGTFHNHIPSSDGYVAVNTVSKTIILAFRGSQSFTSFLQDAVVIKHDYPKNVEGSEVHSGFLAAYKSVDEDVIPLVKDAIKKYPGYELVCVGHSLGGAQALLAALDIYSRVTTTETTTTSTTAIATAVPEPGGFKHVMTKTTTTAIIVHQTLPISVFTYGMPRVGNAEFATYVNSLFSLPVYRVVQHRDAVPRMPMRDEWGYVHCDGEIWLDPSTDELRAMKTYGPEGCDEDPDGIASVPRVKLSVNDHTNYLGFNHDVPDDESRKTYPDEVGTELPFGQARPSMNVRSVKRRKVEKVNGKQHTDTNGDV
ncbi:alpha/beta-hydrolase [Ramicandelaber brevisporus]|nr:alpha/beta-hydrolase [Ramicandelaber brevisporus]